MRTFEIEIPITEEQAGRLTTRGSELVSLNMQIIGAGSSARCQESASPVTPRYSVAGDSWYSIAGSWYLTQLVQDDQGSSARFRWAGE